MSSEISSVKVSRRNRTLFRKAMLLAAVGPVAGLAGSARAALLVFSDNFSAGSTLNGTSTPSPANPTLNGSKTSYDIASSKNQSPAASIASGALKYGLAATTSGIEESQAVFTSSPITLATAGDFLDFQVTFTDTGINTSASSSSGTLDFGLFDSGGVVPLAGTIQNSGIASGSSSSATGGVQNWLGYVDAIETAGATSKIATRPAQAGPSNTNQDLIGDGASASSTYDNPAGASLVSGSTGATVTLSSATQYTEDFNISLASAGTYTITSNLYTGANTSGTLLATQTTGATVTGTNFFSNLDAFAIGYRETGNIVSQMNVNSIQITDLIQTGSSSSLSISLAGSAPSAGNQNSIGSLAVSGSNGNYLSATTGVSGNAQTTGYATVTGFNPKNDGQIFGLDAVGTGSLAQFIADLNTALAANNSGATVESVTTLAGTDPNTADVLAGDNIALLFPAGLGTDPNTDPEFLEYDLSNYTSNGTWTITSITAVPEPTGIAALGLGAMGLTKRRRARRDKATKPA